MSNLMTNRVKFMVRSWGYERAKRLASPIAVLRELADRAGDDGRVKVTKRQIAEQIGRSTKTVSRSLKELEREKLIHVQKLAREDGSQDSNHYTLILGRTKKEQQDATEKNSSRNIGGEAPMVSRLVEDMAPPPRDMVSPPRDMVSPPGGRCDAVPGDTMSPLRTLIKTPIEPLPTMEEVVNFECFEANWSARRPSDSPEARRSAFSNLSGPDRAMATANARRYQEEMHSHGRMCCDGARYLREKRWEGLDPSSAGIQRPAAKSVPVPNFVERPQTDNDRIKAALWNARGPDIYDAWFSGLDCKIVDGVARVLIPTKLKRSTIAEKFEKDVLAAVRLVSEGVTSLELVTAPDTMVGALGRKTGRSGGACIETPPGPAGSCFARPQSS